jgi:hypothetical protein
VVECGLEIFHGRGAAGWGYCEDSMLFISNYDAYIEVVLTINRQLGPFRAWSVLEASESGAVVFRAGNLEEIVVTWLSRFRLQ